MSTTKKCYAPNCNKIEGAKKGKLYEIISLLALAKKGYELSKHENGKFRKFSIGREVGVGKYRKFDDVVFSYVDQENTRNLIFFQLKHYQFHNRIDSWVLSTEADRAKDVAAKAKHSAARVEDVRYGNMCKDFNLQKYFISFLSAREGLENITTEELKDGKIKCVVLFTNIGLDIKELEGKGFIFKKAPGDIVDLCTLSSESQHHCYQLGDVSEGLRKILEKSSDLDRLARELAQYVVCEDCRENRIMGTRETPIKHYHVALEREVIRKSPLKRVENKQYFCEARFREDFLDCDGTASNLHPLRKALFEAIREMDESKKDEDELKRFLKEAKWKIVYNFEKSKQTDFPCEWIPVRDEDIKDFLQCFVFIVNQPTVAEFELLYQRSIQGVVVENTSLKQLAHQIMTTGLEFRDCVEKVFGIDIKPHDDEKWISRNQIEDFMKEKQQLLHIMFVVRATTQIYQSEIMQYGEFSDFGQISENVKNFLTSECKILFVNTPVTLLSSTKISQSLITEQNFPISVSLNILNCAESRDCVLKAFKLECVSLLTIECRHAFKGHDINFLHELVNIAKTHSNKKIILIMQPENYGKHFKSDFEGEGICVVESDSVDLKDFEPREDPLSKKVLLFQGQKAKESVSGITGIYSWNSCVDNLCQGTSEPEQGIIDGMTLIEILSNDEIEMGSKPEGTSSLEGAYAKKYDEINVETLVNKLTSQERDNDLYIFCGITGSSEQDKTNELIQCLGREIENAELKNGLEEFRNRLKTASVNNLKVFDDPFKVKNFHEICHSHPEKRIFWICVNEENDVTKFTLQEIYNPKFYLKRKFKNVIIKKDLKEHLIKDDLSEIFIFHCAEDKQELYNSMELNSREIEQFENSCMIKIRIQKSDAEADFECFKKKETVHLLEFEKKQFVWCKSHGSEKTLHKYIDYELRETSLMEEDTLITKIKDRKVVIFADDPGMGKTTTLIKLYETEIESSSIIKSHWVIGIKLKDLKDLEFNKDGISIVRVVELLSKMDSKLNNNLAKNVLKIALDKSGNFQAKPLLLVLDGFDEVLEEDRNCILQLLKFIKDKTAAKLWITTRCHFKKLLEEELSAIAIQFSPMDDTQKAHYITTYLQHRFYLILNKERYTELFGKDDKKQNNEKIHMYTAVFINKMKSIFRGDIARFIGTPLQLYLMLEGSATHFKKCMENDDIKIPNLHYVGSNVCEIYEHFIDKKYYIYFHKAGIEGLVRQRHERFKLDQGHKTFAVSKFFEENTDDDFEQCKDIFLLVGVIKSQGSDLQFIHKTFEEFFASKVFMDWIKKAPNTNEQEYLLTVILMKPDYQLVRTFMNLQLQKLSGKGLNGRDKSLENYGNVAAELFNQENSSLIHEDSETPLHIAVQEGNGHIVYFLLNILKGHPDVLKTFLFTPNAHNLTALHLACLREDIGTVKALLDAAAGISKKTLQEFLKFGTLCNVFEIAKMHNKSVEICKELLSRANDKLDLILLNSMRSALCTACLHERENFVEFLLQEFEHDTHSLKKLLLYNDACGNALGCAKSTTTVEKLISAAKSVKDDNETLKKLLLPDGGNKPFQSIIWDAEFDVVEKVLQVSKKIDEDTLKQLLLNKRPGISALHVAAKRGRVDIIKLLLKKAADLGIDMLEKLIYAVDKEGKNTLQSMVDRFHVKGTGTIIADILKIFEEEKYQNVREKVMEMLDNEPLKSILYFHKEKLIRAIEHGNTLEVKDILSKVKSFSVNGNESLRILLLDERFLFNKPSHACHGQSALHVAVERGHFDITKLLLETASAVRIDDHNHTLKQLLLNERCGQSALHVAERRGHFDITKLLLETASALGIDDDNHTLKQSLLNERCGQSALHVADGRGHFDITKLLLQTASSVRIDDDNHTLKQSLLIERCRQSALHVAARRGHFDITKLLLETASAIGIDDDNHTLKQLLWNESGVSALHVAVASSGGSDIVKLLLEKTASALGIEMLEKLIFAVNKEGKNAIQVVAERDPSDWTKLLLKAVRAEGIDDDTQKQLLLNDILDKSYLHFSIRWGGGAIAKLLLEKTASALGIEMLEKLIFAVNKEGKNAIQLMVDRGHVLIFADSFIMLEDEYPDTWEKMKDNVPLESRLYLEKVKLMRGRDVF